MKNFPAVSIKSWPMNQIFLLIESLSRYHLFSEAYLCLILLRRKTKQILTVTLASRLRSLPEFPIHSQTISAKCMYYSTITRGGSRISQRGRQPERGSPTYYLAKICQKLHKNEENWIERGHSSKIFLCRSATAKILQNIPVCTYALKFVCTMWHMVNS